MKKPILNHAILAFAILALVVTACGKAASKKAAVDLKQEAAPPPATKTTSPSADQNTPDAAAATLAESIKDIKMTILSANTTAGDATNTNPAVDDTNETGDSASAATPGNCA